MGNLKSVEEALRTKNRHDLLNILALNFTNYLFDNGWFSTCLNCHYWKDKEEMCSKYNQRPPAKIIISGCEEHTDIPF